MIYRSRRAFKGGEPHPPEYTLSVTAPGAVRAVIAAIQDNVELACNAGRHATVYHHPTLESLICGSHLIVQSNVKERGCLKTGDLAWKDMILPLLFLFER
jgi:hypothetical protein